MRWKACLESGSDWTRDDDGMRYGSDADPEKARLRIGREHSSDRAISGASAGGASPRAHREHAG